jgi:hypothetical protein
MKKQNIIIMIGLLVLVSSGILFYQQTNQKNQFPISMGSTSKQNITYYMNCELPTVPQTVPSIKTFDAPISGPQALSLIEFLTGETVTDVMTDVHTKRHRVNTEFGGATVQGYNNVLYLKKDKTPENHELDPKLLKANADKFVEKVLETLPPLQFELRFSEIYDGRFTEYGLGNRTIHTKTVRYDGYYKGIRIRGVSFTVDLVNGEVYEFEYHLPQIIELDETVSISSPAQTLEKLVNEDVDSNEFFNKLSISDNSTRYINSFELVYYYHHLKAVDGYTPIVTYMIKGTELSPIYNREYSFIEYILP